MAQIILDESAAPATPSAGKVTFYAKSDGLPYSKDDAGTETALGGAPASADFLVKTAVAGLSAERVVTDGTSITADWAVAGEVTFKRAALTGDVTASADANATTIAAGAVTYAKMQDVSATDKVLGRSTAGAGDVEEIACTAAGRALIDDASAAAQRTTLGLGTLATQSSVAIGTDVTGLATGIATALATPSSANLLAAVTDETGSGLLVFGTSPTLTTPTISGAIAFPDNTRQTFNPGADAAGLNVGSHAGDPGTPSNGDIWYDSTANELTAYINGANTVLGAAGSSKPNLQWTAQGNQPPASAYATPDTRNSHPVLDFDADTDENAIFGGVLPTTYAGGGLTIEIYWTATSGTADDVVWNADIERMNTDLDADSFVGANAATSTTNGTSGIITKTTITFTNGADMDSLAAGEAFRLKITRDANAAGDTMTGDAELHRVVMRET